MKTLFLVLDTVRADYLGCYGNTWVQTPHLDRLAGTGFVFDNHWVGSLPCMPARREFMTGRHNFLDRGWGPIEPFDDTLPVELRKRGIFSHLATDHQHYFELGGENYHTGFNTWDFQRGQEYDAWASLVDAPALPEHLGRQNAQNTANRMRQVEEEDFSSPGRCNRQCAGSRTTKEPIIGSCRWSFLILTNLFIARKNTATSITIPGTARFSTGLIMMS